MNNIIKNILFSIFVILAITFTITPHIIDVNYLCVQSNSMSPTFKDGDLLITYKADNIEWNDIIAFKKGKTTITHRVVETNGWDIRTKGDANEEPDRDIINTGQVLGKVYLIIPYGGLFQSFASSIYGIILFIIIPFILIIIHIFRANKHKSENKPKKQYSIALIALVMLLIVSSISVNTTISYFSDVEISKDNTITVSTEWSDTEPPILSKNVTIETSSIAPPALPKNLKHINDE